MQPPNHTEEAPNTPFNDLTNQQFNFSAIDLHGGMKNEKGKMKKERGERPPVAEWLRAIEKIKNYELRIIRRLACIPLTLTPLTLSPAIDLHRGMKKEKDMAKGRRRLDTSR